MATCSILLLTYYLATAVIGGRATTYSNWEQARTELTAKKALWEGNDITEYVHKLRPSCFCPPCWIAPKYILITHGRPTYVEFDAEYLAENSYFTCSALTEIASPLSTTYHNISAYYDKAIDHAQRGIAANCNAQTTEFPDAICNGSITFGYDDILYYPTTISLGYGPFIADAGQSFHFECLQVYTSNTVISGHNRMCEKFVKPSQGDDCGLPGTDCAALRAACVDCPYNNNQYGACGGCTLEATDLDELMCSGMIPKERVCPDVNVTTTTAAVDCCDPEVGPGPWLEGGYCCSDGEWYTDPGDGSGSCAAWNLSNSQACGDKQTNTSTTTVFPGSSNGNRLGVLIGFVVVFSNMYVHAI